MKITKAQSKQLRYICGAVEYNQPCTRKYTGGPEGKIREIGKFKYIEQEGELLYFEYDGDVAALSRYTAEEFLSALMDDSGFHLGGGIKVEDFAPGVLPTIPRGIIKNEKECLEALAPMYDARKEQAEKFAEHITVEVPPQNEVHKIDIPIEVQPATDDWMDGDGNDPDSIDQGMADTPELLTEEEKKAAEELPQPVDTATNIPPVEIVHRDEPETKPAPVKEDRWGEALREVAMTAAAREAAKDCGIEGVPDTDTSVDIVRTCYATPGFMNIYGECLKRVGNPRSLEEIAEALPAQREWLFK